MTLAPRYVVVLVAAPSAPAQVDRIAAAAPPGSIAGVRGTHVVVLAPGAVPGRHLSEQVPGAVVSYGRPAEPGLGLANELRRAEAVLAAATSGGPGWYGPDDLLLERLIASNPQVTEALVEQIVAPLRAADRGGPVEATLRSFLRTGSIPETAALELVHPNTVAYRLRRVTERTGHDPRIPAQAAVLALALLADATTRRFVDPTT